MHLSSFVESRKWAIIERWKQLVLERLHIQQEESELLNDLPEFLEDLAQTLREFPDKWLVGESARKHGRQRMRLGIAMGSLIQEMGMVGECIVATAKEEGLDVSCDQFLALLRVISSATATSVDAYSAMRDEQLADQMARHFSFIAHEIRNPLHNATMSARLLSHEDAQVRTKHMQRMEKNLGQLSGLVHNSLIQARMYGKTLPETDSVDVEGIVAEALESVEFQAAEKGIVLHADVAAGELDADRKLILSALTNLLGNAVKFTRPDGKVSVEVKERDGRVLFSVEDECGGMPEDLPGRLFRDPVQEGTDRSGFGLGLLIVKQAVESHQGSVDVDNRPGKNCCITLDLPKQQPR